MNITDISFKEEKLLNSEIDKFSRWNFEVQHKIQSEYISQSFKIQQRSSYLRQNYFSSYLKANYIRFPVLSLFSILHSIKVYWKRKSYLSWGGFDQKVLLPN